MSFQFARPGIYRCDTQGCTERVVGDLFEIPEGWATETILVVESATGAKLDEITQHRCPKHQEPK